MISGTFRLGSGEAADKNKTQALPAGSFFAFVDEETVVRITTTGPWGISYVNPADDPRRQPQ